MADRALTQQMAHNRASVSRPTAPHPWTLTALGTAWVSGALLAALWPGLQPEQAIWFGLCGIACVLPLALAWQHWQMRWVALLLCCFLLGLARCVGVLPTAQPEAGSLRQLNLPADIAASSHAELQVRGVVIAEPALVASGRLRLQIAASAIYSQSVWAPTQGSLLALVDRYASAREGDLVVVSGVLQDPPTFDTFDYAAYLLRRGVGSYMRSATTQTLVPGYDPGPATLISGWREATAQRINQQMSEPAAGLLRGILLGQQDAVAPDVHDDFLFSGTVPILAISGANITLLVTLVFMFLRGAFGLPAAVLGSAFIVFGYSAFVDFGWPVWRAALMSGVYLVAYTVGRPVTWHTLLALTAAFFTLLDPLALLDLGFELSFASMVGLLVLTPVIGKLLAGRPLILQALALSVGVPCFTDPIIALQASFIALIAPVANLVVEPLLLPVMLLGMAHALVSLVFAPLAQVIAWAAWVVLSLMIWLVHVFALSPTIELPIFGPLELAIWYVVLGLVVWFLYRRANKMAAKAAE